MALNPLNAYTTHNILANNFPLIITLSNNDLLLHPAFTKLRTYMSNKDLTKLFDDVRKGSRENLDVESAVQSAVINAMLDNKNIKSVEEPMVNMNNILESLLSELGNILDETIKESDSEAGEPIPFIEELKKYELYVKQVLMINHKPKIPANSELINLITEMGYQPIPFLNKFIEAITSSNTPNTSVVNKFLKENTFEDIRIENNKTQSLTMDKLGQALKSYRDANTVKKPNCECDICKAKDLIKEVVANLNFKEQKLNEVYEYRLNTIDERFDITIGKNDVHTYIYINGRCDVSFKTPVLEDRSFKEFCDVLASEIGNKL